VRALAKMLTGQQQRETSLQFTISLFLWLGEQKAFVFFIVGYL
jgi:hypothetical protein